jgi:hypothetical protein
MNAMRAVGTLLKTAYCFGAAIILAATSHAASDEVSFNRDIRPFFRRIFRLSWTGQARAESGSRLILEGASRRMMGFARLCRAT